MLLITAAILLAALAAVAFRSPQVLTAAFNPVTLNLSVAALALIAVLILPKVPAASRCLRRKPEDEA